MHHRFGIDWPEVYRIHEGCMWTYEPEYYRLQRKEHYEERKATGLKYCVDRWEHDGYGYFLYRRERENDWALSRIDLDQYYGISYTFYTREQLEARIEREGWRPFQQMVLPI